MCGKQGLPRTRSEFKCSLLKEVLVDCHSRGDGLRLPHMTKLSLGGAKQVWSDVESKGCRYLSRSGEPPQWECGVWRPPAMQYYHCLSLVLTIWTKCTVMCDFNSLYCHNEAKCSPFANRIVT